MTCRPQLLELILQSLECASRGFGGTAGDINLIGWTGDFGDPDNFLGTFFKTPSPQWGFHNNAIFNILAKAAGETNYKKRIKLYQQANILIMKFLPGVPYAHSTPALAFQKKVKGYTPSPVGTDPFAPVFFANLVFTGSSRVRATMPKGSGPTVCTLGWMDPEGLATEVGRRWRRDARRHVMAIRTPPG